MVATSSSPSQKARTHMKHPVIDSDGHVLEMGPLLMDYVRDVGGGEMVKRLNARNASGGYWSMSPKERRDKWMGASTFWVNTGNTVDRATASLPRLLHSRMDELGMDFTVLYPTLGLSWQRIPEDDDLRRVLCRALNTYHADIYREYSDRLTPAAAIPMQTPTEAIEELEHSIKVLGLKAAMLNGYAERPVSWVNADTAPAEMSGRMDTFGIDSDYDYDQVWAKCVELGVAPTFHTGSQRFGTRRSYSNYMCNQIGHFAAAADSLCKSLFMGGVTRRFPTLKFGFLECGVGWACTLYSDLISHWRKRNGKVINWLDPQRMDREELKGLIAEYGDDSISDKHEALLDHFTRKEPVPDELDNWAPCLIDKAEDIRDLFVPNFFFGCEADDPINAWAFNDKINPFGARLRAIFSSDISHWDVPDMRDTVAEAYELVEHGLITDDGLRDFTFTNPVALFGGMNPDFFKGTRVEAEVAKLLKAGA